MPTILTLQGPNLSLLGVVAPTLAGPLAGPIDTMKEHPWAILVGLFAGGFLASKYAPAWGSTWGGQHAAQSRDRAIHGHSFFGRKLSHKRRKR